MISPPFHRLVTSAQKRQETYLEPVLARSRSSDPSVLNPNLMTQDCFSGQKP